MKRGPEVPSWSFKGGESQLAPDKSVGLLLLAFAPASAELGRPALSLGCCLHPGMGSSAFKLLSPWMSVCSTESCSLMLTEGKGKLRLRERGAGPSDGTTQIPPTIGSLLCTPTIPEKVLSASSPPPRSMTGRKVPAPLLLPHLQPPSIWGEGAAGEKQDSGPGGFRHLGSSAC